jgi:hypothetical protein
MECFQYQYLKPANHSSTYSFFYSSHLPHRYTYIYPIDLINVSTHPAREGGLSLRVLRGTILSPLSSSTYPPYPAMGGAVVTIRFVPSDPVRQHGSRWTPLVSEVGTVHRPLRLNRTDSRLKHLGCLRLLRRFSRMNLSRCR